VSLKSVKLSTETTTLTRQTQTAQHETPELEQNHAEGNKGRTETDRYIGGASPLPEERALGNFVIISYNDGAKEYECQRCGAHLNTAAEVAEHKQNGCVPTPAPTQIQTSTTTQTQTPTQVLQSAEPQLQQNTSQEQKEFEERLRAKIRNGKAACADGESMKYDMVSANHGKCTGFYTEDDVLPELTKYGNKLYVFHCEDGAVAYICSICRTGFMTLQSFEKHAKETHGWEFH